MTQKHCPKCGSDNTKKTENAVVFNGINATIAGMFSRMEDVKPIDLKSAYGKNTFMAIRI